MWDVVVSLARESLAVSVVLEVSIVVTEPRVSNLGKPGGETASACLELAGRSGIRESGEWRPSFWQDAQKVWVQVLG